jgi:hypothetical protein
VYPYEETTRLVRRCVANTGYWSRWVRSTRRSGGVEREVRGIIYMIGSPNYDKN